MSNKYLLYFLFCFYIATSPSFLQAQTTEKPWLSPAQPSVLEWVLLDLQANDSDREFGDNGLTVEFHFGPKSLGGGVIYCRIMYLPSASAELVQLVEKSVRDGFELKKSLYPWARLEIYKEVARLKGK